MIRIACVVVTLLAVACGSGARGGPMTNKLNGPEPVAQQSAVISVDILAREPISNNAKVKHILIGWKDLAAHDPRAEKRTKAEAEAIVRTVVDKLKGGADFDAVMKEFSEDPGSAASGRPYEVSPDAQLVIEFKQLGLRLRVGEFGVVESDFGFHIMKRFE
jgi:foldase protein PrsA